MTHFTSALRDRLELHQILIYFAAVLLAAIVAVLAPAIAALEQAINPALALMLFVTFLQVPLADLGRAVTHTRFLAALLVSNFLIVPLLVVFLVQFVPADPMIRLGFLLVLFIVVAAVVPQSGAAIEAAVRVLPLYAVFAAVAPFLGWGVARFAGLQPAAGRAVAFSSATRNSLVVLPLALAVPGGLPVLPAIVVTQTMVELVASVLYMRWIPKLGGSSIPDQ